MMKYSIFIFLFVLCGFTVSVAQPLCSDTIANRMWRQMSVFPQEKLYAQIDRAEYTCGDTIWVRHHVVDALTGMPSHVSRYVYVELVNPLGKLVGRYMMRQNEQGIVCGYIPTEFDMPSGTYMFRAYTRYMSSTTPDYLFERTVRLRSAIENSVRITADSRNGKLRLSFINPKTGRSIHNGSVRVSSADGEIVTTGNTADGVRLHMADIGRNRCCLLVEVGNYREFVPVRHGRIDLQLMPEGGNLIMGKRCRVAYKTVADNGLGIDMHAVVTDDNGNVVAESGATHLGMGMFYFTPQKGRVYKVTCSSVDGQTTEALLPKAKTDSYSLSVTQASNNVIANIVGYGGMSDAGKLWIVVHQGGAPLYVRKVESGSLVFARRMFDNGIVHFVLADSNMNIVSERMAFMWNGDGAFDDSSMLHFTSGIDSMRNVEIVLPDTVDADCAVSVVDADMSCADTVQNIVSSLVLSQELRGFIEQPAWYFGGNGRQRQLDLLMMTQGWRRYDMSGVLGGQIQIPKVKPEVSMCISGKVMSNLTPHGRKGASVTMSSSRGGLAEVVKTDNAGRFYFEGFEMPDSTGYMLLARSAKGSANNVISVDSVYYPDCINMFPQPLVEQKQNASNEDKYAMARHDVGRMVFLPEVTVTERYRPRTEYEMLAKIGGRSITSEMLKDEGSKSVFDYLKSTYYTGLIYNFQKEWFYYNKIPSYLVVDGTMWSLSAEVGSTMVAILQSIRANKVKQIDIIKGPVTGTLPSLAGYSAFEMFSSAIVVTTKDQTEASNTDVVLLRPLGYQRPAAFYNPKYDAPDDYALRQTVYWNPSVLVKAGKASMQFLPNGAKRYRITIEGVDRSGKLISVQKETE